MQKQTLRYILIMVTTVSFFVSAASYYLQYVKGLTPCPLCLMQRLCVIAIFFCSWIGLWLQTRRPWVIFGLQIFFSLAGIFFAGRQLWLQALPLDRSTSCMPGLDILVRYFPWQDVAKALFWGNGDCGEVAWKMLGLSLPAWVLLYFIFTAVTSVILYKKDWKF